MDLFTPEERAFAQAVGALIFANPFAPEWKGRLRDALGGEAVPAAAEPGPEGDSPSLDLLAERVARVVEAARTRMLGPEAAGAEDLALYEDLALFHLWSRRREGLGVLVRDALERPARPGRVEGFEGFLQDVERYLGCMPVRRPTTAHAAHLFACLFQVRRALHLVSRSTLGRSGPAAALRAAVWESIFTHDLRRYWAGLFDRTGDYTILLAGPRGIGKEPVARAIGQSRYIAFDPATRAFTADFTRQFLPLDLDALPPSRHEPELFGYRRGAFPGALEDRAGLLESCPRTGTVLLEEIGVLEGTVQAKLLRVLRERAFQRLGETGERVFRGKLLASTGGEPADLLRGGRMRPDLHDRLGSDVLRLPSLRERLDDDPAELERLVRHFARREAGEAGDSLASETLEWIGRHLGPGYPWPGNLRELDQCVRTILVRGRFVPPPGEGPLDPLEEVVRGMRAGTLPAEDLLGRYVTWVYARTGSYLEAARRLGLDRRTVKARVDEAFLRRVK